MTHIERELTRKLNGLRVRVLHDPHEKDVTVIVDQAATDTTPEDVADRLGLAYRGQCTGTAADQHAWESHMGSVMLEYWLFDAPVLPTLTDLLNATPAGGQRAALSEILFPGKPLSEIES